MKYETMLSILFLLLSGKKCTAQYIADRFSISRRTVMRYLDVMSICVPILSDQGRGGGFYIADSYKLPACFMSEREFNSVISVLSSYNKDVSSKTISSAIDKLSAIKRVDKRTVSVSSGNFIIDGSSWNGNDNVKNVISTISNAIDDSKQAFICYEDKNGKQSERTIEPHAIILKQGLWYVYAYCTLRNSFRMFKASRIKYANPQNQTFEKRKIEITSLTSGKWFENLPIEKIELEIASPSVCDVEEWLGIDKVYKIGDKTFASATLPYDSWLISKILSFGGNVKVLSPQKLKKDLISTVEKIKNLYN